MLHYPVVNIYTSFGTACLSAAFSVNCIPVMIAEDIIKWLVKYGDYKLQVAVGKVSAGYDDIYIGHTFLDGWSIDYINYLVADCKYLHVVLTVVLK